jgi:hypothetical protein
MERRAFLQLLCVGIGAASVNSSAKALNFVFQLPPRGSISDHAAERSVAAPEDIDDAKIEKVWYGHWRRVNRRHYRRVSRRVYRRHYYY